MSKTFVLGLSAGLLFVALVVWGVLYAQRGAHLAPTGVLLHQRTVALDDQNSALIVDFRASNSSDVRMEVRTITFDVTGKNGAPLEAAEIAASDLKRLLQYHPELGAVTRPAFKPGDFLKAGETIERVVAARFTVPESALRARKQTKIEVEDLNGAKLEMVAK